MKTSKLSDYDREIRRETIMHKRAIYHTVAGQRGRRPYLQYMTTRFRQHCGERQTARYVRQLAAGQISFIAHGPRKPVEPMADKPKRKSRAKKASVSVNA